MPFSSKIATIFLPSAAIVVLVIVVILTSEISNKHHNNLQAGTWKLEQSV
jgi:hypothetical protein